jgi:hypothetical protein
MCRIFSSPLNFGAHGRARQTQSKALLDFDMNDHQVAPPAEDYIESPRQDHSAAYIAPGQSPRYVPFANSMS